MAFFRRVLKFGGFRQNAKGGPLAFWPKWPIFMAQLRKPRKIANTYRVLVKMVLLDAVLAKMQRGPLVNPIFLYC